jgi:hypothetical protein
MEEADSAEILVTIHQATLRHIIEDSGLQSQRIIVKFEA